MLTSQWNQNILHKCPRIIIFVSAIILRLSHALSTQTLNYYRYIRGDSEHFHNTAWKVITGAMQTETLEVTLSPVYLAFLGLLYKIFGHTTMPVQIIQSLLGSLLCVLLYEIGKKIWNQNVGLLAGFMAAFCGIFIFYESETLKPALINVCLITFIYLLVQGNSKFKIFYTALAAFLFGCALLMRMHLILFFPVVLIWLLLFLFKESKIRSLFHGILFSLVLGLTIMGWKNWFNHAVPNQNALFSQGGIHFYIGNNETAQGVYKIIKGVRNTAYGHSIDAKKIVAEEVGREVTNEEVDRYWLIKGLSFIKNNPGKWLKLEFRKLFLALNKYELPSFENYPYMKTRSKVLALPLFGFGFFVPFAILGIFFDWKKRTPASILITSFIAVYIGALLLTFVRADYRFPLHPFLILFAAFGLDNTRSLLQRKEYRELTISAMVFLIAFVFSNYQTFLPEAHYYNFTKNHIHQAVTKARNKNIIKKPTKFAQKTNTALEAS